MRSLGSDSSVLLWFASACIAFIGARAFVEYLRRLHHEGPIRLWRELLFGALALVGGVWGALIIDVTAQGLPFDVGYHPLKNFGALLFAYGVTLVVLAWVTYRPKGLSQLAVTLLAAAIVLILQMSVIWSVGAEPGLSWQPEPLAFSAMLTVVGLLVAGRMVVAPRRGSRQDRRSRRLLAGLILGAALIGSQELVLISSGLTRQVVSAHARFLPEVALTLLAGAALPIALVLMLVDQRSQQRVRASERAKRRLMQREGSTEAGFNESAFLDIKDAPSSLQQR